MPRRPTSCGGIAFGMLLALGAAGEAHATDVRYRGLCDASAAVSLDRDSFVVANDEDNRLREFGRGAPDPRTEIDLGRFLQVARRAEADIEGAAPAGDRTYWITSHSRNAKGKYQASRHRLFATGTRNDTRAITTAGRAYRDLVKDLAETPSLARYGLAQAAERAAEAPGGLNIEGLAATDDGRLLVGFRNPLFEGRALIVPIENPTELIDDKAGRARLGSPIELDLGGRGIRSLERIGSEYYVVAGPIADEGSFALFRWSGKANDAPVRVDVDLGTLRPEALFAVPGAREIVLLSDDGGIRVDGIECKRLDRTAQSFRALTLAVPP